ncbi:MAG: geranylgeranyl reductase family protein [Nonlabens sp.]
MENNTLFDVAIIGTGPAGSMAAYDLAVAGMKVLIIEKRELPRYKVCGGGFVYRGLRDLPFNTDEVVDLQFKEVDIYFDDGSHLIAADDRPVISMVMRDKFDYLLTQKAMENGAVLKQGEKLTALEHQKDQILLATDKNSYLAKTVIAADGAYSPTAKMAGWKNDSRTLIPALEYEIYVTPEEYEKHRHRVRFDMGAVPHGYGWVFPKNSHLSVGVGGFGNGGGKLDLKSACMKYIDDMNIKNVKEIKKFGFNIPITPREEGFVKNGVFLTGDAAGFADPITAEGISNAIFSGRYAAQAIIAAEGDRETAAKNYETILNEKLLPQLATGRMLASWFYGKPKLRSFLIKRYGTKFARYMTAVFCGDRNYPINLKKRILQKSWEKLIGRKKTALSKAA